MISAEQLAAALKALDPRDWEVLDLSLRRRVPDEALAKIFEAEPAEVARRRASAIENLADALGVQRGEDLGAVLKALLDAHTWEAAEEGEGDAWEAFSDPAAASQDPIPDPEPEARPREQKTSESARLFRLSPAPDPVTPGDRPEPLPAGERPPPQPVEEPDRGPGRRNDPEPATPMPAAGAAREAPASDPAQRSQPGAQPGPGPAPEPPPRPGPVQEPPPGPGPVHDAQPGPGSVQEPQPGPGSVHDAQPGAGSVQEPQPGPGSVHEAQPGPGPEPKPEPKPRPKPEPVPEPKPPPEQEPVAARGAAAGGQPYAAPANGAQPGPVLDMLADRDHERGGERLRPPLLWVLAAVVLLAAGWVGASLSDDDPGTKAPSGGDADTRRFLPAEGGPLAAPFPSDPKTTSCYSTAYVRKPATLYSQPGGRRKLKLLASTEWGSPRVLSVVLRRGDWLAVLAPELKNGEVGWMQAGRVSRIDCVRWSLHVDLSRRKLYVRRDGHTMRKLTIAIGSEQHPTPQGRFAVTDKLKVTDKGSPYGCCVLALTGHQSKLPPDWPGGDRLAVHATTDLSSIGKPISLGCMRSRPESVRWLIREIPLGSPMFIRA